MNNKHSGTPLYNHDALVLPYSSSNSPEKNMISETQTHTHTPKKKKQLQATSHKNSPSHGNHVFIYVSFILHPPMSVHLHPALNRIGNPWMKSVVRWRWLNRQSLSSPKRSWLVSCSLQSSPALLWRGLVSIICYCLLSYVNIAKRYSIANQTKSLKKTHLSR